LIPTGGGNFPLGYCIQTGPGTYPAAYKMGAGGFFLSRKVDRA